MSSWALWNDFVPELLGQVYRHWQGEALDGIYPWKTIKTGEREVSLTGMCILLEDQCLTPIHVQLRYSMAADELDWIHCRVGAPGEGAGGLFRLPYGEPYGKQRHRYLEDPGPMEWVFTATYGDGRPS